MYFFVPCLLRDSENEELTYNFTRALTQTKGKSKTNLKDSIEEGCSAHEGSNLSFTSA